LEIDIYNPKRLQFPALVFYYVMYGRVLLISGDYEKLIGSADHFFSVSSVYPNLMGYVYTHIYLAAAYGKLSREQEARANLIQALEIAMPDKQYMLFVENCDYIAPLLRTLSSRGLFTEDIERILILYETYARSKEEIIRMYFSGSGPSLTEREMDVSRLVAEGLTNREIAQRLYISINTVKALLKTIYSKLSINNRIRLKQYVDTLCEG
jgi:LuxR family maltose regulon positive regulatory protein